MRYGAPAEGDSDADSNRSGAHLIRARLLADVVEWA
jgi:hypothetical protein